MKKRIAVLTLCVFMIILFTGFAVAQNDNNSFGQQKAANAQGKGQAKKLADIEGDWAEQDIEEVASKGFIKGYEDGTFQPNKPVTCLETIIILVRAAGLEDEAEDYVMTEEEQLLLKKIPDWGKAYVAIALQEGILDESEIKTFNPNQGARRYQVCIYMQNVLDNFNLDGDDEEFMENFIDGDSFPLKARNAIRNMARLGVVNGYPNGSFEPNRVVKRNELARMINCLDRNCIQRVETRILTGTLDRVDFDGDVLYLEVIDNEDQEWNFAVFEDDDIDIYYDGEKLDFDDLDIIEAGQGVRIRLDNNEDPIWIKISLPD